MNVVKLASKPASLAGAQLIYEDGEAGIYKLDFTAKRVSWRCIDGSFTGESGSAAYRACRAAPDTLLIAWSQPTGEAAVVVVNVPERQARVCHFYGEECSITPAKIVEWVAGDSSARTGRHPSGATTRRAGRGQRRNVSRAAASGAQVVD